MAVVARRLVSTNKRRYEQDGYSLDLSYITPRIMAMGFPCDGVSSLYRNPVGQVQQLLNDRHANRYKVYNLCVERGYDPAVFGDRVVRLPMYDGQAPPLHLMLAATRDAAAWLAAAPDNVVVVHCKAGKGRTGAVVCALLIAMDPELGPSSYEAVLTFWARQRTKDGKGLTIPSQRRFLFYFHQVLLHAAKATPVAPPQPLEPKALQPNGAATGAAPAYDLPLPGQPAVASRGSGPSTPERFAAAAALAPGVSGVLHGASVPHRAARLLRVRFRGLPTWLLRDCTACVWWRPAGHHEAHPVCLVHTAGAGGLAGCVSGGAAADPPVAQPRWAIRRDDVGADVTPSQTPGAGRSGGAQGPRHEELELDLSTLPPLQPAPPPAPLPFVVPSNDTQQAAPAAASEPPAAANEAAQGAVASTPATLPAGVTAFTLKSSTQPDSGPEAATCEDPGKVASGGPVIAGDIKIQIFRGHMADPPHDVFKGRATQFSAWLNTAFLDPRVGQLELGRSELDKLSKRLRRWRGPVSLVVEYEVAEA